MSEPEGDAYYYKTKIPLNVLNILLWGTALGGFAVGLIFALAWLLIVGPLFGWEVPRGSWIPELCFSMAFICSIGYAIYFVREELARRWECEQRGLTLRKD